MSDLAADAVQQEVQLKDAASGAPYFEQRPIPANDDPLATREPETQALEGDVAAARVFSGNVSRVASAVNSGTVATTVIADAYPGKVLSEAIRPGGPTLAGAAPAEVAVEPAAVAARAVLPLSAQRASKRVKRASAKQTARFVKQGHRIARKSALSVCEQTRNLPCRWAPNRIQAMTNIVHPKNSSSGLYRKAFEGYVRWTQPQLLLRYQVNKKAKDSNYSGLRDGQPFGFEFGAYPANSINDKKKLWSDDWSSVPSTENDAPSWPNGLRWSSNLPNSYLDNLDCDIKKCLEIIGGEGRPNFSIGTPRGDLLRKDTLYNARYYTNYGQTNKGPVIVEAQLTRYCRGVGDPCGYCAYKHPDLINFKPQEKNNPRDCWFANVAGQDGKGLGTIRPTTKMKLRYNRLWRCTPGTTENGGCVTRQTWGPAGEAKAVYASLDPLELDAHATPQYYQSRLRASARWAARGTQLRAPNIELRVWDESGHEVDPTPDDLDFRADTTTELLRINPLTYVEPTDIEPETTADEIRVPVATFSETSGYGRQWLVGICYRDGEVLDGRPVTVQTTDANGVRKSVIRVLDGPGHGEIIGATNGPWTGPEPPANWCPSSNPGPDPGSGKPTVRVAPKFVNCEDGPFNDCTLDLGAWNNANSFKYAPAECDSAESCEGWLQEAPEFGLDFRYESACQYTYGVITIAATNASGTTYLTVKSDSYEACNS